VVAETGSAFLIFDSKKKENTNKKTKSARVQMVLSRKAGDKLLYLVDIHGNVYTKDPSRVLEPAVYHETVSFNRLNEVLV
jgi:hypothetical protein